MKNSLPAFLRRVDLPENARIALVGIGNELTGDDAAGVLAARRLLRRFADPPARERLLIIEAGPSPEGFTGPLRRFAPHLVLLLDAAELSERPGAVRVFDWSAAQGLSASTHTLPPTMLAEYLVRELGCQVALVGIQPQGLDFDAPVSRPVRAAVSRVVSQLWHWLSGK